jgi:phage terminase large subunit-like protein
MLAEPPGALLRGDQRPRLCSVPPSVTSEGDRVIALARAAKLELDDWEGWVLDQGLGRRADGVWSAFEVALIVSRQNGKGSILEALELAALFIDDFGVELILHSAHEFKTASEAFRRILARIENNPQFKRRIKQVYLQRGAESIELRNGKRLRFIARSSGSGRGFSADLVILDEAYELGDAAMAALLPTLSARPNPQIWYTSTAGVPTSTQLGRTRARGLTGTDSSLAFMEWSVDPAAYDPADPRCWAQANPGLGIRITPDYVERERAALGAEEFARERLGVGTYPTDLAAAWQVVSREAWAALADVRSVAEDPVAFGAEVTLVAPHRQMAAICAVGLRSDGRLHLELVEHREDVDWVIPRLVELRKHRPCAVVIDPSSHAGALIEGLEKAGVEVAKPFSARDAAQAFGQFRDAVAAQGLRHMGQEALDRSLGGATTRPLSDALAWDRKSAVVDLGPVVSASLALWGFNRYGRGRVAPYDLLRSVG